MSHFSIFCIGLAFLIGCSQQRKEEERSDEDTLVVEKFPEMEMDSSTANFSQPIAILENADTLYNILARQKLLEGEFMGVTVMTESFIDLSTGKKKRNLLAALIETGEGEYSGGREGSYEATHAILAVFEQKDDGLLLVAQANVGEGGGYGLKLFTTTAETVSLMPEGEAVMVHSKASESGAGDYGFRKDDVSIYILINNTITSVFEATLEDYQFTSDEQTSMAERTVTAEITVLETTTKGLYDIRLFMTTVLSSSGGEEEGEAVEEETAEDTPESEPDPGQLFTWDGSHYR